MEDLEVLHPEVIAISLILSVLILFIWKKKKKFKDGVMVANTSYVKELPYYKKLLIKYRLYNTFVKIVCIGLIFFTSVLTARIIEVKKEEEIINNRDIMLCMDVSGSVSRLNSDVVDALKETVLGLKGDRFGITVFDGSPVSLVPLTTDYDYVISVLDQIKEAYDAVLTNPNDLSYREVFYMLNFLIAGTSNYDTEHRGTSLIPEGVAYCTNSYKKDDDRTRTIILTTDNHLQGTSIITMDEAANYAKSKKVKVYAIGTTDIEERNRDELMKVSSVTSGVYYDMKNMKVSDIVNDIDKLNKSELKTNSYIRQKDMPEIVFPYLLYLVGALFLIDWRVKV